MKNLRIMIIGAGLALMSTVETVAANLPDHELIVVDAEQAGCHSLAIEALKIEDFRFAEMDGLTVAESPKIAAFALYENLGLELPSESLLLEAALLKVPIYSVPLREENKVVLVKDPKGFVERAIRHDMEFLAIKPMEKGDDFWETVPVFSVEKSLTFNPKSTTEIVPEDSDMLRLIPVKDFIRYN